MDSSGPILRPFSLLHQFCSNKIMLALFPLCWCHSHRDDAIPNVLTSFPLWWCHSQCADIIPTLLTSFPPHWQHSHFADVIPALLTSFPPCWWVKVCYGSYVTQGSTAVTQGWGGILNLILTLCGHNQWSPHTPIKNTSHDDKCRPPYCETGSLRWKLESQSHNVKGGWEPVPQSTVHLLHVTLHESYTSCVLCPWRQCSRGMDGRVRPSTLTSWMSWILSSRYDKWTTANVSTWQHLKTMLSDKWQMAPLGCDPLV